MSNRKIEKMSFCVHSFMSEDMGLSGAELLIFAIIYSFTKGDVGLYYGTQNYLSRVSGTSESTVKRALIKLQAKGFLEKRKAGEREGYSAILPPGLSEETTDADAPPNDEEEKLLPAERMKDLNIDVRSKISAPKRPKYEFHPVGRHGFVAMTAEQYKRLLGLVSSEVLANYINRLELLIMDKDYRTYSPYKTIKKWIFEDAGV